MNYNVKKHNIALANIHIYFNMANYFFQKANFGENTAAQ